MGFSGAGRVIDLVVRVERCDGSRFVVKGRDLCGYWYFGTVRQILC